MDDGNVSILVASERYWLQLLIDKLKPCIFSILKEMYSNSYESVEDKGQCIIEFMEKHLKNIPHWNNISVERECNKIINGNTSIPKLFKRVFILDVKILMVLVEDESNSSDIEINVPPAIEFIHKSLISCAETIYDEAQAFYHEVPYDTYKENVEKINACIDEGIKTAIRNMIPEDELLSACLSTNKTTVSSRKKRDDDDDEDGKSVESETSEPNSGSDDSDDDCDLDEPPIHVNSTANTSQAGTNVNIPTTPNTAVTPVPYSPSLTSVPEYTQPVPDVKSEKTQPDQTCQIEDDSDDDDGHVDQGEDEQGEDEQGEDEHD